MSTSDSSFPYGTFIANVLACLILGFLLSYQMKNNLNDSQSLLLITGFCGGFSTFSTFSSESMKLFQSNQAGVALFYIGTSIIAGLIFVYVGYKVQTAL